MLHLCEDVMPGYSIDGILCAGKEYHITYEVIEGMTIAGKIYWQIP